MTTYENKLNIIGARVLWNDYSIVVEEVPVKGNHKLRLQRTTINTGHAWRVMHRDDYIVDNILRDAIIDAGFTYETAVKVLKDALAQVNARPGNQDAAKWGATVSSDERYYLEVAPEGAEPKVLTCKDFTLEVKWTKFSAYSPSSDFNQPDPYYTQLAAPSAAAGRKLYKLVEKLTKDGYDFSQLTWANVTALLDEHKVAYKYNHSVWH